MSSLHITAQQILDHRASRKATGLGGCITGKAVPAMHISGFKDVQIWNMDASGRLNGSPGFNRKDPMCFCFDCRGAFDKDASVDLELIQESHPEACKTYASLIADSIHTHGLALPPPTPRDVASETPEERLTKDLTQLRNNLNSDLVVVMDKRRMLTCLQGEEREAYADKVNKEEEELWLKIRSIDILLGSN